MTEYFFFIHVPVIELRGLATTATGCEAKCTTNPKGTPNAQLSLSKRFGISPTFSKAQYFFIWWKSDSKIQNEETPMLFEFSRIFLNPSHSLIFYGFCSQCHPAKHQTQYFQSHFLFHNYFDLKIYMSILCKLQSITMLQTFDIGRIIMHYHDYQACST